MKLPKGKEEVSSYKVGGLEKSLARKKVIRTGAGDTQRSEDRILGQNEAVFKLNQCYKPL